MSSTHLLRVARLREITEMLADFTDNNHVAALLSGHAIVPCQRYLTLLDHGKGHTDLMLHDRRDEAVDYLAGIDDGGGRYSPHAIVDLDSGKYRSWAGALRSRAFA